MSPKVLSSGSLNRIFQQKDTSHSMYVQVLGSKELSQNRYRLVIWDGKELSQHCIVVSETLREQDFDKFTIYLFEGYCLSDLPKKENVQVILVNHATKICNGSEVGRKLKEDESWEKVDENRPILNQQKPINQVTTQKTVSPQKSLPASDGHLKNEVISPISAISPFYTNWVIRARVTSKTPLRTYNNAKGSGKILSFDVCDESGEIRVTCFNAEVDRFGDMIEKGKIYLIAKGMVKNANKKFSSVNNDYEITLGSQSMIELYEDAVQCANVPSIRFRFVPISNINNLDVGTAVDVSGVIKNVGNIETIISRKTQKELQKREVSLVDKSLAEVRLTIWGEDAANFNADVGQVLCCKSVNIGDFRGKTLSTISGSVVEVDMKDVPEVNILKQWWKTNGSTVEFTPLSNESTGPAGGSTQNRFICQLTPSLVSNSNSSAGQVFTNICGTILATSRQANSLYKACGNNTCTKKVAEGNEGVYYCAKCDRSSPNFEWRMMLSINIADATGDCWITAFQEYAEKMLGMTTREVAELYENNQDQYTNVLNQLRFKKYNFRIGSKIEEYNNERRVRNNAYNIQSSTPSDRIKKLATFLEQFSL